jgi:hypothetical protein
LCWPKISNQNGILIYEKKKIEKVKSRKHWMIYIKAFVSLLFWDTFIDDCVDCNFQKELESNDQLRDSNEESKCRAKVNIKENTLQRRNLLRRMLLKSFIFIFSAIFISILGLICCSNYSFSNVRSSKFIFAVMSLFLFSWATLGRLGWHGQSCGGNTVFENLDNLIFKLSYWLGTLFGILALGQN